MQAAKCVYALSALGILEAEKAFKQAGYLGIAPVPLAQYCDICLKQTSRNTLVVKELMLQRFSELMFSDELIATIGPALNSSKPMFNLWCPWRWQKLPVSTFKSALW